MKTSKLIDLTEDEAPLRSTTNADESNEAEPSTNLGQRSAPDKPLDARFLRVMVAVLVTCVATADLVQTAAAAPGVGRRRFAHWSAFELLAGARFGLLCSAVALLVILYGVVRGRRNAWRVAIIATVTSALAHPVILGDLSTRVLSFLTLGVLIVSQKLFQSGSDPRSARNAAIDGAVGLGVVFGYGVAGLYLLDSQFRSSTTIGNSIVGSARLLFLQRVEVVSPITRHGHWFIDSVRLGVAAVLVTTLLKVVKPVLRPNKESAATRQTVSALLERYADSTLAYFHNLPDKHFVVSADQQAFIGFSLVGSTALALGDPVGEEDAKAQALADFLQLGAANGWVIGFHQATTATVDLLKPSGYRSVKVGEEAFIELNRFNVGDPQWKSLRSALRRVERNGFRVVELGHPLPAADLAQLRNVSQRWIDEGDHRERTFALGQFHDDYVRSTRVLALQKHSGEIVAFVNLLPRYQSSVGNFDLMRRTSDSPNGTMEALFVAMIDRFTAEGCDRLTLGMAPLAGIEGDRLVDRLLRSLRKSGRGFHYGGIRSFKEKWDPVWEARYLVYPGDVDLARMARAVPAVGELGTGTRISSQLGSIARKFPLSTGVFALAFSAMALGSLRRPWHTLLLSWFGLAGNDIARGQLWRIATNAFLQPKAGFMWSEVALLVVALPIAEHILSTKLALIVAICGDWIATIVLLAGIRIFVPSYAATPSFTHRDAGASVATWALAAGASVCIQNRLLRVATRSFVLVWLLGAVIVHHQLFDVQHLIGGSIGALVAFQFEAQTQ